MSNDNVVIKTPLLSVRNMDVTFGKGKNAFKAVNDVSFDVYRGETFGLVGESGSGKTTIGRAIIRINKLSAGEVIYDGKRISGQIDHETDREVIKNIQMIFQDPMASLNERAKVDYIVSEGLTNIRHDLSHEEIEERLAKALLDVGLLPEFASRFPHEFSGGQRQRIGIARCLVMDPEFIIADEPISALDVSIRAQVLNLMSKLQQERGLTYLFIAHDLSIVRFISDHIGVIYKGDIVEIASAEELFNYPLHPYTRSLISAIPIPDPELEKNKVLFTYDPSVHDYSEDKPEMTCIGHDHYIFGNKKEIEEYKTIREKGEPIKSITIVPGGSAKQSESKQESEDVLSGSNYILETPLHDTGNIWYSVGGFFLPITGLIVGAIFKRHKHIRNFKACKKGSIIGLLLRAGLLVLFFICLLLALL